jgi:hypothetical protein
MIFSAVALAPGSALADVHDCVRVAVEARNLHQARAAMKRSGCVQVALLRVSKSHVEELVVGALEQAILAGKARLGTVLAAPLVTCYTDWSRWEKLRVRKPRKKTARRSE